MATFLDISPVENDQSPDCNIEQMMEDSEKSSIAEILPDEILEKIFSYCSHKELIETVQNVNTRWRQIANSARVWKNIVYVDSCTSEEHHEDPKSPDTAVQDSDEDVIRILELSPRLRTVIFTREHSEKVLQTLTGNCHDLKKLVLCDYQNIYSGFLKNLQESCPDIEHLGITGLILTDSVYREVFRKFTNLKTIELAPVRYRTDKRVDLKVIADYCKQLAHFEFRDYWFGMEDFRYFFSKTKDKLESLHMPCSNLEDDCILPILSENKPTALKSLCLYVFEVCDYECKTEHLGKLKSVTSLTLHRLGYIEPEEIIEIFDKQNMSQLKELTMLKCFNYDEVVEEIIYKNCPLLKSLVVPRIEDADWYNYNKLFVLKAQGCHQ